MFAGFDPHAGQTFFERKRGRSLLAALLLVGGSLGSAFYLASREAEEPVEEEIVEAEIQNFEMEEELEEEPEPEPPPPEPPSNEPKSRSSKPTPAPDIQNPDQVDQTPEEGQVNDQGGGEGGGGGSGDGGGGGSQEPEPEPEPEPEEKPKPKGDKFPYNPDKPIERPADATVPKQVGGNPPVYPAELRKRNITGKVKVRLTIYKDGSVKGAKVLAKENSVDKDAEPDLYEQANKLLLKAVAAAVQTWKFKPSTYKGKPISVFLTVTIPFTLN